MSDEPGLQRTTVGQLPAIVTNGKITVLEPEMERLADTQLKEMAHHLGGELIYLKLNIMYSMTEVKLCQARDCYRPGVKNTETGERGNMCSDHTN